MLKKRNETTRIAYNVDIALSFWPSVLLVFNHIGSGVSGGDVKNVCSEISIIYKRLMYFMQQLTSVSSRISLGQMIEWTSVDKFFFYISEYRTNSNPVANHIRIYFDYIALSEHFCFIFNSFEWLSIDCQRHLWKVCACCHRHITVNEGIADDNCMAPHSFGRLTYWRIRFRDFITDPLENVFIGRK